MNVGMKMQGPPELLLTIRLSLGRVEGFAPAMSNAMFGIGHLAADAFSFLAFRLATRPWHQGRSAFTAWSEAFRSRSSALASKNIDG